jgi:hypothetical protein
MDGNKGTGLTNQAEECCPFYLRKADEAGPSVLMPGRAKKKKMNEQPRFVIMTNHQNDKHIDDKLMVPIYVFSSFSVWKVAEAWPI